MMAAGRDAELSLENVRRSLTCVSTTVSLTDHGFQRYLQYAYGYAKSENKPVGELMELEGPGLAIPVRQTYPRHRLKK